MVGEDGTGTLSQICTSPYANNRADTKIRMEMDRRRNKTCYSPACTVAKKKNEDGRWISGGAGVNQFDLASLSIRFSPVASSKEILAGSVRRISGLYTLQLRSLYGRPSPSYSSLL